MINTYKELFVQYCNAMGKRVDFSGSIGIKEIEKDFDEFTKWLYEHANDTAKYGRFLRTVVSGFESKPVLELNKGFYDTLSRTNNNVDVMPTYRYSMDLEGNTLLFAFDQDKKLIVPCTYGLNRISNLHVLNYDMLLSHNPYTYGIDDVHKTLSVIHRQGNYDVSFGVYGKESDSDKKRKLDFLKSFAHLLDDEYKLSYETDNGLYFASVNSKRKEKVKTK